MEYSLLGEEYSTHDTPSSAVRPFRQSVSLLTHVGTTPRPGANEHIKQWKQQQNY